MGNTTYLSRHKDRRLLDMLFIKYNGNQLKKVDDWISSKNLYNTKEYANRNGNSSNAEFTYDANGNMTKDLDRRILNIKYNILNLPDEIWFSDGSLTINQYDASGQKLWTRDFTLQTALIEPLILYSEEGLNAFFENYSYGVNDVYEFRTDYVDNMEFKSQASQPVQFSQLRVGCSA